MANAKTAGLLLFRLGPESALRSVLVVLGAEETEVAGLCFSTESHGEDVIDM